MDVNAHYDISHNMKEEASGDRRDPPDPRAHNKCMKGAEA